MPVGRGKQRVTNGVSLPGGQITAKNLPDVSTFGCFSFVLGYFPEPSYIIATIWWLQVLVWLGIFQLFSATNISGKTKMFGMNPAVSHRFEGCFCRFALRDLHAGHPHLGCGFLFPHCASSFDPPPICGRPFFHWSRTKANVSRLLLWHDAN